MNMRQYGCFITLIAAALIGGCQRPTNAVEHPGQTMTKPVIFADCIARYFKTDQTAYITRQTHQFDLNEGFFAMTAKEPTGPVHYTLYSGQFKKTVPHGQNLSDLPREFCTPMLANGIFYSFCAGSGLLDLSQMPTSANVKVEGRWYTPITAKALAMKNQTVTLYKALDTQRVELLEIRDDAGTAWLFRNYNLRYSRQLERKCPRAIDVFDCGAGLASKKLIVQFQYENVQKSVPTRHLQPEE